ncbi:S41 family peptidase [Sphingomonas sp. NSE70-1]|uniref:S41 family peptidase n=1 Tax=Sphingomonas caseinilyticus TaxID=2908205 RepID=A0ABT0RU51_9SPHN|nr:S41 family peptidase [Sphingomonas caseinilyticus]MCL6698530.1 S41 family peptidase [Sphingomonas caseinilyticus]
MTRLFPIVLAAVAIAGPLSSQPITAPVQQAADDPFRAGDAKVAVENLATALESNFVFPDVGKAYAAMLRSNLASGAYDSFPNARAFAIRVSNDLQAVHKDGHLRLHVIPPEDRGNANENAPISLPDGSAITRSGWLAPGVAYISFAMFPGNEATLQELRKFLDAHKDAKTLIIDARAHRGGGMDEMDMIFGEIFSKPADLLTMDTRRAAEEAGSDPDDNRPTIKMVPTSEDVVRRVHSALPDSTPTALRQADVYYLTSKRSASAAEHLALAFKRSHRATVIGETTYGAGHYGRMMPVGSIYAAFIPVGRTFDPDNGEGWEGVGVKPDVAVSADQALDEALRRAGVGLTGQAALAALR